MTTPAPSASPHPDLREMLAPPSRRPGRGMVFAAGAAAVVVAALLVLVATGVLRPSSAPSTDPVTVSEVHWTIIQGTVPGNSSQGWFGPNEYNYTHAEGYPLEVAAGGTFTVSWVVSNVGGASHTVYSVAAGAPFVVVSSHPALPLAVPAGEDDATFVFTIQAPNSPGGGFALSLTVTAVE